MNTHGSGAVTIHDVRFGTVAILCALLGLIAQPIYAARAVFCCCEAPSEKSHSDTTTEAAAPCCQDSEAPEPGEPDDNDRGCECPRSCCNSVKPAPAAPAFDPDLPAAREIVEIHLPRTDRPRDAAPAGLMRPPRA